MPHKKCCKCKELKDVTEFHKASRRSDGRQSFCKSCSIERRCSYYQDNKTAERVVRTAYKKSLSDKLIEYKKTLKCSICGESRWYVLDLHHASDDKEHDVSSMASGGYSWKRIMVEIAKCAPVCANCHREIHFNIREDSK